MKRIYLFLLLTLSYVGWSQEGSRIIVGAACMEDYVPMTIGKQVGIVANHTSVVDGVHLVDTLISQGVKVKTIFCPEHGFRGKAEAGAHIKDGVDSKTGLPIVSLYGKNKKPTISQLQGIEVMIFDLQDVGCRFYTYISTLHYVMEACVEEGIPLVVLDRPNPNGGYVDGPVLDSSLVSFVGMRPGTPIVYGMTMGEYAMMIDQEHALAKDGYQLKVVTLQNYSHDSVYHLPIAPSPNLQTPQAIALYPSLCWFEGTNISVGRGTQWPFEIIGNPDYPYPTISFKPQAIPGVSDNPPFKGVNCYGLDLRTAKVDNRINLSYLLTMYNNIAKDKFFIKGSNFFDKLAGTKMLRQQLQSGASEEDIRKSWEPGLEEFRAVRQKYLLYQ